MPQVYNRMKMKFTVFLTNVLFMQIFTPGAETINRLSHSLTLWSCSDTVLVKSLSCICSSCLHSLPSADRAAVNCFSLRESWLTDPTDHTTKKFLVFHRRRQINELLPPRLTLILAPPEGFINATTGADAKCVRARGARKTSISLLSCGTDVPS